MGIYFQCLHLLTDQLAVRSSCWMVPAAILFHVFYTFNLKTLQTRTHLARCSRTQKKEWRINKRTPELNFAQKPTLVVSSVMTKVGRGEAPEIKREVVLFHLFSMRALLDDKYIYNRLFLMDSRLDDDDAARIIIKKWVWMTLGKSRAKWNVYVERIDDLLFLGFSSDKIEVRDLTPSNVTFSRQGDSRYLRMLSLPQRGNSFLFSAPIGKLHNLLATPRNRFFTAYGRKRVPLIPGASFGPKSALQQYLRHFLVYILQSGLG